MYFYRVTCFMLSSRLVFVAALLLFWASPVFAQKSDKIGRLSAVDFTADLAKEDADAPCVDLYKHRTVTYDYNNTEGFIFRSENVLRRKILTTDGLDKGTITLRAYFNTRADEERIEGIDGYTYNVENGQVVRTELKSSGIFREKEDDFTTVRIVMPNVRQGSVIELRYTLRSPFLRNVSDFRFRDMHPVMKAVYDITVPDFLQVMMHVQAIVPFTEKTEEDKQESFPSLFTGTEANRMSNSRWYHWALTNQTALHQLPYSTTPFDFANTISTEFQRFALERYRAYKSDSWQSIADNILDLGKVKSGLRLKLPLPEVLTSPIGTTTADTTERVRSLYKHFQHKMRTDNTRYLITKRELGSAYQSGAASGSDINLMLANSLRSLGIPYFLLLVSTRENGRPPVYPRQSAFDRIICATTIGKKLVFMDASDKDCPFGLLSLESQNGHGLLLSENAALIPLYTDVCKLGKFTNTNLTWDAKSKNFSGTTEHMYSGYWMAQESSQYRSLGMVNYMKAYAEKNKLPAVPLVRLDTNANTIALTSNYQYEPTEVEGELYLDPLMGTGLSENLFVAPTRDQDVNLGGRVDLTYMVSCQIPPGYSVKSLPQGLNASLGADKKGKITYSVSAADGKLTTVARVSLKEPVYYVGEYEGLRAFFNHLVTRSAEQIVLKKL